MADESAEKQDEATESGEKKPSKKILIVVGAIMALEGIGVAAFMMLTGGPADANAAMIEGQDLAQQEQLVEIDLVRDKFQNMHGDRIWLWDTEVKLKVREKDREFITQELEDRRGEIIEGISLIFRRAQPSTLKEPGLETLNRQITALLQEIFGNSPDGSPRIERVLLPKCLGFPAN